MPLSFIMGLIGCFADRPRWLAILMTLLTGAIIAFLLLPLVGIVVC